MHFLLFYPRCRFVLLHTHNITQTKHGGCTLFHSKMRREQTHDAGARSNASIEASAWQRMQPRGEHARVSRLLHTRKALKAYGSLYMECASKLLEAFIFFVSDMLISLCAKSATTNFLCNALFLNCSALHKLCL